MITIETNKIELLLQCVFELEKIQPSKQFGPMIQRFNPVFDELTEDELEFVAAAKKDKENHKHEM